jgi:hypothetical protein
MKVRRPLAGGLCILTLAAATMAWQPETRPARSDQPQGQPGEPGQRGRGGQGQGPATVEGSMKGMNRALRQLNAQIGDASKKDDNLRIINDMQRACVNAKGAPLPEGILKKAADDAAKAKLHAEFRHELIKAMRLLLDIETAIADGKGEAATAKLEELKKLRDHAHEEMGVED